MAAQQPIPGAAQVHHRTCHLCDAMCDIEVPLRAKARLPHEPR